MAETRQIIAHPRHPGQGPHLALPAGFPPLRLCIEALRTEIEVTALAASVGRHSDADLRLAFPDVSRKHCRFAFDNGVWRVFDLHSLNGIYVNNVRISETILYAGDHVRIGSVTLLVLAATPVRDANNEKLRQIADALPMDNV